MTPNAVTVGELKQLNRSTRLLVAGELLRRSPATLATIDTRVLHEIRHEASKPSRQDGGTSNARVQPKRA